MKVTMAVLHLSLRSLNIYFHAPQASSHQIHAASFSSQ